MLKLPDLEVPLIFSILQPRSSGQFWRKWTLGGCVLWPGPAGTWSPCLCFNVFHTGFFKKQPSNIIGRAMFNLPPAPSSQCCLRVARGWNTNDIKWLFFFEALPAQVRDTTLKLGAQGSQKRWRVANMRWLFFWRTRYVRSVLVWVEFRRIKCEY